METNKYSPGPWKWDKYTSTTGQYYELYASDDTLILSCNSEDYECYSESPNEANTNLVEAVPDLLEALQAMKSAYPIRATDEVNVLIHKMATDAINKALKKREEE